MARRRREMKLHSDYELIFECKYGHSRMVNNIIITKNSERQMLIGQGNGKRKNN